MSDLADEFGLTEEERQELLPSGKQTKITNRVHWARSYLKQAGLVQNPKRGWYELSEAGRNVARDETVILNTEYLKRFDAFNDFMDRSKTTKDDDTVLSEAETDSISTPDESIQTAHQRLNEALASNLLDLVRNASPAFFERLIVDLLLAMGYGGSWEEAGRALGQTGDNGIDGVIDQDPLGIDQIYIQAKRYGPGNTVGAGDIRDFFGALNIKKATKGIFVTTSTFSAGAKQTVKDLGSRIVLIDGQQLARLMIRYNIGCRDKDIIYIKQVDESFFEEDLN